MASNFRRQIEAYKSSLKGNFGELIEIGGQPKPITDNGRISYKKYRCVEPPELDLNYQGDPNRLGKYTSLVCFNVMEYVWNPASAFQWFSQLLINGGCAYVSFPFVYPHHDPKGTDFLRYTDDFIYKVFAEYGFEILELIEISSDQSGHPHWQRIVDIEGFHVRKDLIGKYTFPIGYIVKAIKVHD